MPGTGYLLAYVFFHFSPNNITNLVMLLLSSRTCRWEDQDADRLSDSCKVTELIVPELRLKAPGIEVCHRALTYHLPDHTF